MNIKSIKFFFFGLFSLLILWRLIFTALITFEFVEGSNSEFINYAVMILIICLTLLITFFLSYFSDLINRSQWIEGEIILKKRGAFNSFNRAEHYDISYKTYFKLVESSGIEHRIVGIFLPEDAIVEHEHYHIKVRNKRILEFKKSQS